MTKPFAFAYAYIGDGEYMWFSNHMADIGSFVIIDKTGLTIRKKNVWRNFKIKPIDFTDKLPEMLQSVLE